MMLCKLSLKNIQKSFKDYAIYFFTLILGISIFYVFNALDSQTVMMNVSSSTKEIIGLMTQILSGVSVFVSFILGFLIIYASRFLIKRRNKEFGIYLTLGMSKRKISTILLIETLLIGIISLIVGLGLGVVLSQFMSILVANMFEADLTKFAFSFSRAAFIKTIIYFSIMYLFVMTFNTYNISRCKLIDLLQANKKQEKIKLKNPILCTIIFIISSCILGYAYYMVTGGIEDLTEFRQILIPISLGSICTFTIIWSLSGLLITIFMNMKKVYYKGLNSFTLRQVSSKVNTTAFSMTIICIMLFITICVLSSALSIKNSMTYNLKTLAPIDINLTKSLDLTQEGAEASWNYTTNMVEDSKLTIRETLSKFNYNPDKYFTDIVEFNTYATNNITVKDTLGSYYEKALEKYPYLRYDAAEELIKVSDYNKAAKLLGQKEVTLKKNEYIIIADYDGWIPIRNEALKENTPITINGNTYYPKYKKCQPGIIEMAGNHVNMGIFVLPDEALDESIREKAYFLANYKEETKEGKEQTEETIRNLRNHSYNEYTSLTADTKISIKEASVGLGAMVTFIGLYLGIIFLISSAALLALKELSESSDNKLRFKMLRRLGVDEKMLNKALFRQIAIFFLFPLLLAIIHSIFGIMFANYILETFGNEKLLASIIMTTIFIIIIYGGYFLITYTCSKNIIKEN